MREDVFYVQLKRPAFLVKVMWWIYQVHVTTKQAIKCILSLVLVKMFSFFALDVFFFHINIYIRLLIYIREPYNKYQSITVYVIFC